MQSLADTRKTFREGIRKLRAAFGAEKFPDERCDLVWEELKSFSSKQIDSIFKAVIGESKFTPSVAEFREKASILRERIREFEKHRESEAAEKFAKESGTWKQMPDWLKTKWCPQPLKAIREPGDED